MEQINFSNKRLVSDAGETKTYLINVNGTDVRVYESTKTSRFGFNMKDLAKAFNYETVEEFQSSEQWIEFSSQISENLQKNTGNESEAQIGKVSDVIGEVPAASTLSAKSAKATSQWVERAGINGALTAPDDVFLYGGGTLDEAVEGVTPILFRADGSGHVANRNISWDALGNLLVRGVFESNNDGNRIIIDPDTRSIKLLNNEGTVIGYWSFSYDYCKINMTGNGSNLDITPAYMIMRNNTGKVDISPGMIEVSTFESDGQTEKTNFSINYMNETNTLKVIAKWLPTSSANLEAGQIWNDNGTLKIK